MSEPTQAEIQEIFKKLRAQRPNKACFDCMSKTPTWASASFGVYLCLDCSSVHRNMGVHISFVRSTQLDSWTWDQLRIMKVGGNAAASDFFAKHGSGSMLSTKDVKAKYTSKAGQLYREALLKRAKEDSLLHPHLVVVEQEDSTNTPITSLAANTNIEDDDDFFSSWEKPTAAKAAKTSTTPRTSGGTSVSRTTASSLRSKTTIASSGGNRQGAAKPLKLGAKKVGAPINFEEAERRAKEEAERKEKTGYSVEEEEGKLNEGLGFSSRLVYQEASGSDGKGAGAEKKRMEDMERLGLGMGRLGFGALPDTKTTSHPVATKDRITGFGSSVRSGGTESGSQTPEPVDDSYARQKFANQKAISSDEFFGRGTYDPSANAEASSRLSAFAGASSISSNQYFGREENVDKGLGGGYGDIEGLQGVAVDFARKLAGQAGADLGAVGELVGKAGGKLQDYIQDMQSRYGS